MRTITFNIFKMLLGLVLLVGTFTPEANATHTMGLDLTYRHLTANRYEVNLSFYRDCNGITPGSTSVINWETTANITGSITLTQSSVTDITLLCNGAMSNCANGSGGTIGVEKYTYTGILIMPTNTTACTISYMTCCRNSAVTSIASYSGLYVESFIDVDMFNSSPYFTNEPISSACTGQTIHYNHGAVDVDGDELRYSLTPCLVSANAAVNYNSGFTHARPLGSTAFSINTHTGAITFTAPNAPTVGVVCVLVEEYRNGVKIGEVTRDIQISVHSCSNNSPTLSGVNNTNSYTTTIPAGSTSCFDVFSNDIDANQQTVVSWNQAIAGATFTGSTGTTHGTGTFCWTPTTADIGTHVFTAIVRDNSCPLMAQNIYTYTIIVDSSIASHCDTLSINLLSTHDLTCFANDGEATISATNGAAPYTYKMVNTATSQMYANTTGTFTTLRAGTYRLLVRDANGCTGLSPSPTATINSQITPLTSVVTTNNIICPSNAIGALNNTGSIIVTPTGGTAPYVYSLNGGLAQSSPAFNNLIVGNYSLQITDFNGCVLNENTAVSLPAPVSVNLSVKNHPTCGLDNGSVTVYLNTSPVGYTYTTGVQTQNSPTFGGLAVGYHFFTVVDSNGCTYTDNITLRPVRIAPVTMATNTPSCTDSCKGRARVFIGGVNTLPAAFNIVWSDGATTISKNNLCDGIYSAVVTDTNNCQTTVSAIVRSQVCAVRSVGQGFSTNDGSMNLLMQLAPNPASTVVQAAYETIEEVVGLTVLNINGQTVYQKEQLDGTGMIEIKTEEWASGMYFVVLRNLENKVIETQKLIIRK